MAKKHSKKLSVAEKVLLERYAPLLEKLKSSADPLKERNQYLPNCNDEYTSFILEKLESQGDTDRSEELLFEIHHIIPRACGGPDEPWNIIRLTYLDHNLTHEARYSAYGEKNDRLAVLFRKSVSQRDRENYLQRSLETRRREQLGIHNPAVQSKSGKKGGNTWTEKKRDALEDRLSEEFKTARTAGMKWTHKNGITCNMKPNQVHFPMDLVELLHAAVPYSDGTNLKSVPGALQKVLRKKRQSNHG